MKKPFNFRPLFFIAVSLCLGIAMAKFLQFKDGFKVVFFCLSFLLVGGAVFIPAFKEYSIKEKVLICLLLVLFFLLGVIGYRTTINNYDNSNLDGHYYTVSAKVVDAKDSDAGQNLILSDVKIVGKKGGNINYKIRLYVYGDGNFDKGDLIEFSANLYDCKSVYENKLSTYNIIDGIKYTAEISSNSIVVKGKSLTVFESINLFIRQTLKTGLSDKEFGVGYALLTGNSDYMDMQILQQYRFAGVAHIFAVSGLHIGFLAVAIGWMLDKLKTNRLFKAFILSIILFLYSAVCGFTVSSIRASVMVSIALFCAVGGNKYDRLSAIAIACILILTFSPINLFDVGFQLSFMVVIGITLLAKPIEKLLKFLPKKLSESLSVAISAQIASIPICLYHFGYFSVISVFLNVIFIPVVSVIFTVLVVAVLLGGIFSIAKITLFLPNYILKFINICITAVDFDFFLIYGTILLIGVFLIYLALLFISEHFNLKLLTRTVCSILCLVLSLCVCFVGAKQEDRKINAFIIGTQRVCATVIDNNSEKIMIVSVADTIFSAGRFISLANKIGNSLDAVVFLSGVDAEEQAFLTKLRTAFTFKRICCYGEEDKILESIIIKSFGKIKVDFFIDGQNLNFKNTDCTYALEGRAIDGKINKSKFAVFSAVDKTDFTKLTGKYSLMVAFDRAESVFGFYQPQTAVSYRRSYIYRDGETNGTEIYHFE